MSILRKPLVWILLIAMLLQLQFTWHCSQYRLGDPTRFVFQAKELLAGHGYVGKAQCSFVGYGVRPETALPPGYPVFLAGVMLLTSDDGEIFFLVLAALQLLMVLGSCCLVYVAVYPRSPKAAIVAALIMATTMEFLARSRLAMSETLATFLCSLLVFQLSRMETSGMSALRSLSIGVLCVAILLTAPALIVLCALVWCYCAWQGRRQPGQLALLAFGSLLLMVPWQVHCYRAVGHIQPTVFPGQPTFNSGMTRWVRTWEERPAEQNVLWRGGSIAFLPDSVYSSKAEREKLEALYLQAQEELVFRWDKPNDGKFFSAEIEDAFNQAADRRIAENPWRYYFVLPLRRAILLWATPAPPEIPFLSLRGMASFLVANISALALFVIMVFGAIHCTRHKQFLPLLIVASVVIYTVISAIAGIGECRRNIPFYPAILFIPFYYAPFRVFSHVRIPAWMHTFKLKRKEAL
jgi:hypothetical protein